MPDTLLIRDSVVLTRVRVVRDTALSVITRDSIREVPVEVVRVEKVRYVPWWYRYPAYAFYLLIGIGILYAALLIARATIR